MIWFGMMKGETWFGLVRERGDIQKNLKNFEKDLKKILKKTFKKNQKKIQKKISKKIFKKNFKKNFQNSNFPFHALLNTSEIWYIDLHI